MTDTKTVMTVAEIAVVLRVSRGTAYDYVARGLIPHLRLGGRILISRSVFEAWLASAGAADAVAPASR